MAFREKQEVIIREDLIRGGNGDTNYKYHYNGYSREVPLGSKGRIIFIQDAHKVLLKVNGKDWWVHPNEISRLPISNPLLTDGELRHPVFALSYKIPVIISEGKVYFSGKEQKEKKGNFQESRSLFKAKRRSLVGCIETSELDDLFISRNRETFRRLGDEYVESELDLFEDERITSNVDTPLLIVKNIFPYLRKDKQERKLKTLLGIESSKPQIEEENNTQIQEISELECITESMYQKAQAKISEIEDDISPQQRLTNLISERDKGLSSFVRTSLYIENGEIKCLNKSELSWVFSDNIQLNGRRYVSEDSYQTEGIEIRYLNKLWREIRIDAIRRNLTKEKIKEAILAKAKGLERFFARTEYHEGDIGFQKIGTKYYVTLDVPAFALKSQFDKNYYAFNATRVGIRVRNLDSRIVAYSGEKPVIMENNNHPLTNGKFGMADMCYGNNHLTSEGKTDGEIIANRLRQAREIALYGYYGKGHFYSSLSSNERFIGHVKSYNDIKDSGILIIEGDRQ